MQRTWKPTAAGILCIIAAVICIAFVILAVLFIGVFQLLWIFGASPGQEIPGGDFVNGILIGGGLVSIVAVAGAVCAFKRKLWGLALAGSICAVVGFGILGILAITFISLSKSEFKSDKKGNERVGRGYGRYVS
jgi:membrane protease YdiL (CAAX protease family)